MTSGVGSDISGPPYPDSMNCGGDCWGCIREHESKEESGEPKHTVAELSTRFETMFGIPIGQGIERVKLLMRRTISMGMFEAGFVDWESFISSNAQACGRTTINDRDFMMFAFFAMYGLEQFAALPKVELLTAPPAVAPEKH